MDSSSDLTQLAAVRPSRVTPPERTRLTPVWLIWLTLVAWIAIYCLIEKGKRWNAAKAAEAQSSVSFWSGMQARASVRLAELQQTHPADTAAIEAAKRDVEEDKATYENARRDLEKYQTGIFPW